MGFTSEQPTASDRYRQHRLPQASSIWCDQRRDWQSISRSVVGSRPPFITDNLPTNSLKTTSSKDFNGGHFLGKQTHLLNLDEQVPVLKTLQRSTAGIIVACEGQVEVEWRLSTPALTHAVTSQILYLPASGSQTNCCLRWFTFSLNLWPRHKLT